LDETHWHETPVRVRYRDTDRMGVVYYGNFFAFFEVARSELLRDLGFPYSRMEKRGYLLVVVEAAAVYRGNAGYDDVIRMRATISKMERVRIRFEYQALGNEGKLLVTGHTTHACTDTDGRPTRFPREFKALVEERCNYPP
jgi:acyl-CoA thioester hydrolase